MSRKSRRRSDRARAKRSRPAHALSLPVRIGLVSLGALLALAGVSLLIHADPQTANRLGRVAGILILIGLVLVGAGTIGHL